MHFVADPRAADVQILHVVCQDDFEFLAHQNYVLLLHCYAGVYKPSWAPIVRDAVLVLSAYDLSAVAARDRFRFHRSPYGIDERVFYDRRLLRDRTVLTTGYVRYWEAISECREAAMTVGTGPPYATHIGKSFWRDGSVEEHENVTDDELAALYSRVRYVSGLRRREGFELPALEGLACGARPVCFDTPEYRHWYDGHAVFVPQRRFAELVNELREVFARDPDPVGVAEHEDVLTRFGWPVICADVWSQIRERAPIARLTRPAPSRPRRFRSLRLEESDVGFLVRDPERSTAHLLNPTAAVIFELCDGTRDSDAIAATIAQIYKLDTVPTDETLTCLRDLVARHIISWDP